MEEKQTVLFDFSQLDVVTRWRVVDDWVRGGVSQSTLSLNQEGAARFFGTASPQRSAGFASVRSPLAEYALHAYRGLAFRVKTDGKRYALNISIGAYLDSVLYQTRFDPAANIWITLRLPFVHFIPTFQGRVLHSVPPLDPASIKFFELMIEERQPGPFNLEIKWLAAYL